MAGKYCPAGASSPTQCPAGIVEWNVSCCGSDLVLLSLVVLHRVFSDKQPPFPPPPSPRKTFCSSRGFIRYHMLRLSSRYLRRTWFTYLAHHSQRFCLLFSFASRDFRLSALAHYFLPLSILKFPFFFGILSTLTRAENFDPFDLLCIVLMQEATVQKEHLLLVLQVS